MENIEKKQYNTQKEGHKYQQLGKQKRDVGIRANSSIIVYIKCKQENINEKITNPAIK
jgi:hypothetical protein